MRAESGDVAANRSYNIAAERQQLSEKRSICGEKGVLCGLDQDLAHLEVLVCV